MQRAAAALAACLGAFLALLAIATWMSSLDEALGARVQQDVGPAAQAAWRAVSWPGATAVAVAVTFAATAACAWPGERRAALAILGAGLAVPVAVAVLKDAIGRARPATHGLLSAAFPSGHAANAVTAFGLLAFVALPALARHWPRLARLKPVAVAAWLTLGLVVGVARVLGGVHWPTDVAAGWALGGAAVAAASLAQART